MSRADLPLEVERRIEEMLADMAAREQLSRADFRRQVRLLVASSLGDAQAAAGGGGV